MSRLKDRYQQEVVPALAKEFGYKNVMAVPKIEKVVVNMGLGEATQNAKIVDTGVDEIGKITGQKAVVTRDTSSTPVSTIFAFCVASPRPVLTTSFSILGMAMTFL